MPLRGKGTNVWASLRQAVGQLLILIMILMLISLLLIMIMIIIIVMMLIISIMFITIMIILVINRDCRKKTRTIALRQVVRKDLKRQPYW